MARDIKLNPTGNENKSRNSMADKNKAKICSNMDGPRERDTELSQTEKEKYHMTPFIYGI